MMTRISKADRPKNQSNPNLLHNMSSFQDIGGNIFNMDGLIGPAARTGTFAEIPLRSDVRKETVK